ncbi:uncharacterized protein LOC134842529 [Symsagittifera roscoffensis]|uniref:uncharacterized protein LOC134842529 n=1 Tax=Symsagittifera roscoffensis TaxID=84072 RepID=UPI00307BE48B
MQSVVGLFTLYTFLLCAFELGATTNATAKIETEQPDEDELNKPFLIGMMLIAVATFIVVTCLLVSYCNHARAQAVESNQADNGGIHDVPDAGYVPSEIYKNPPNGPSSANSETLGNHGLTLEGGFQRSSFNSGREPHPQ